MRSFRPSVILVTSLALMPLAGVASAGQARPRSAPPAQGSSSGSSSSSSTSSSGEQGRSRTQAQPRERESAPPPQQQQSQRQEQTRERQTQREPERQTQREPQRETQRVQPQYDRPQQQNNQPRQDNSRQAVPAPRDRYIDLNRDGRNDNKDSRVLGPQDRRDLERRYDSGSRYDGRYDRYDSRYSNYSPYRYNGPRVVFAPRESVRFSRPWFSFRPLIRLPFGLTIGVAQTFPSWYRPYIVGRPGYTSPYMPYGGVTFDIEPRDAELWIDGEYIGRVSDYSYNDPPLTLVAGSHYVELRSRYGRPLAFDITVIPGQVIPYQGTLPYYR
jgi:TolA-binding protein